LRNDSEQAVMVFAESIAESMGVQILEMRFVLNSNRLEIRFTLDRLDRSVSISDCSSFSRQLSRILDVEDPIESSYTLQVSSPGLKRLIRLPDDLSRFIGRRIKVRLIEAVSEKVVWIGILKNDKDPILLTTDEKGDLEFSFDNIRRINLHE